MTVLAELGTADPIETAAPKRFKSFNAAQWHAKRIERRRYVIADPVRDYLCHRTLQRHDRREDHSLITRPQHGIDIDDIGCCAFAGTGNRRLRFEFGNFGEPQLTWRSFRFDL
jgi:hypothetical protein